MKPSDLTAIGDISMTVLEEFDLKYPDPCTPPDWVLPFMDYLPYYEDSKTTGSHILLMVHQLQGGASPFGCDASHCRDVMLRYSNSCACLCDFCCRIVSSSL